MLRIVTAEEAEFVGHALDHAIRETVKDLRWSRANQWLGWGDYEREQRLTLRALFKVRRQGRKAYREHQAHIRRAYFEALENAQWQRANLDRQLPDAGDHFGYPQGAA